MNAAQVAFFNEIQAEIEMTLEAIADGEIDLFKLQELIKKGNAHDHQLHAYRIILDMAEREAASY